MKQSEHIDILKAQMTQLERARDEYKKRWLIRREALKRPCRGYGYIQAHIPPQELRAPTMVDGKEETR